MSTTPALTRQEKRILDGLGGQPWTAASYNPTRVADARRAWADLREAIGFRRSTTGWMTTEATSPKLAKSQLPSAGVNLHAARNAMQAWNSLASAERSAVAAVFGLTIADVTAAISPTLCPASTPACREGCVVARSANGVLERSQRARLARTLLTLLAPAHAVNMTADALGDLASTYTRTGARWRVNVSDDIRWELLAPGLFDLGPLAYAYTKWTPTARPGRDDLRVVYSATERWTPGQVVALTSEGHRVALVLDVAKKEALPKRWAGVTVVDGDDTDDLWAHPAGVIVGLRVKGPSAELKDRMRASGFSWPAKAPAAIAPGAPVECGQPVALRRRAA